MELAQNEEVVPVAHGVAAGFQIDLRIEIGLTAAGVDAVLGNYRAVPSISRAHAQAGGMIISQRQVVLESVRADDLVDPPSPPRRVRVEVGSCSGWAHSAP